MKPYKVRISPDALLDIQEATNWYNEQVPKLGTRFQDDTKNQINKLKNNALKHSIRYADVRCALIKKFPFLIHFVVDEDNQLVEIFAILHTSRNPKIWEKRARISK
jgi:plasmid stabilization system protein ParE